MVTREVSLGDYILSGGELGALVLIDAMARLVPGVLGDFDSAMGDSFESGILDCGYYTRPEEFHGMRVPAVLLSGNHGAITQWRRRDALARTLTRRPDLLAGASLTEDDHRDLAELGWSEARSVARGRRKRR
jgi:tRNA (guanine37-N1)-methyltransferase